MQARHSYTEGKQKNELRPNRRWQREHTPQPCLMGMAEVIKPAQLLDKGPAKLSHMRAVFSISTCCTLGGLLIFVQFGMLDRWEISNESFMPSPRSTASKLPKDNPEDTTLPTFREMSLSTRSLPHALETVTHVKTPEVFLWGSVTFFKHLSLYFCRNKILKTKSTQKGQQYSVGRRSWPASLFPLSTQTVTWATQHQS